MKKTLTIIISVFILSGLHAQQNRSFIGFRLGPSFPLGGFSAKELPDGGFALTGLGVELDGAWFFLPWLGVGASANMHFHPIDAGELGDQKLAANEFLTALSIRSGPYPSGSLYGGLYFEWPVVKKLSVTSKAEGGMMYAQTPYQLYKAEYYLVGKNWYEVTAAGDYEGSFRAGAGLAWQLNDLLGFSLQGDYTWNKMEFIFLTSDGSTRVDEKVMSFVNLSAGLVLRLSKH